jgi:hypothetical protein
MFSCLRTKSARFPIFVFWGVLGASCTAAISLPAKQTATHSSASAQQSRSHGLVPAQDESEYRENDSVLSVKGSNLTFDTAILGERDDKPGTPYIRERWHVVWRPGDPIDLYIVKPRGVEKPPAVLYLYSYPQDTDRFKQDYWCGVATGNGFAAVGFVSSYTGQRTEYQSMKDDFINKLPQSLPETVHDVQMILNFLETRNEIDMARVGMLGQGSGGAVAILASAVDPRIKVLDLLTPWGDWPVFLPKSTMVTPEDRPIVTKPEFVKSVSGQDPVDWFSKVQARTVRIQDIRKDGHMPDEAQEKMEAAAPSIAEIDQFGDGAAFVPAAMNGKLLDWIKQQLQPSTGQQMADATKTQRIHYFPPKAEENPLGQVH